VLIALGVVYTPTFARLMRGQVLTINARDYVEAARALGAPGWRVAWRHVVPNAANPIVVQASLSVAFAILALCTSLQIGAIYFLCGSGDRLRGFLVGRPSDCDDRGLDDDSVADQFNAAGRSGGVASTASPLATELARVQNFDELRSPRLHGRTR